MSREYYVYGYCLDKKDAYLIWFSNEQDGFVIENGFVPSFESIIHLQNYADKKQINVDVKDPKFLELDIIQNWLNDIAIEIEDYNSFLDAWNLFGDLSTSTSVDFDSDKKMTNSIYNKIFWGCNIPAMTPEGESFTPSWTKKELKIMREILSSGFQMFREKVKYI